MDENAMDGPVLLYDGVCGLCNKTVQFVLSHDRRGTLRFAPLQSSYGQSVVARHPALRNVDSVVLVEPSSGAGRERVFTRSTAALRVVSYLGGAWKLLLAAYIIPRPIRNWLYDLVARYRYRFFGRYDTCLLPPPEVRARFLDLG
jgi:predicted DCC family thiol-disulfide oxidoreductase YuxK